MPIVAALIILCQVLFVVHVIQTGRDRYWIGLIIMVPGIGCLVYFLTQILPEMLGSRSAHSAKKTLIKAVDPQRELRNRMEQLKRADTINNRMALAEECLEAGMFDQAIELMEHCLTGMHEYDPAIMEKLASAKFEVSQTQQALDTLETLIAKNPDYRSHAGHLLYARCLQDLDRFADACVEYDVLRNSFPGEEARVRYGEMLLMRGHVDKAHELFRESIERAELSPKHYRKREKPWLDAARQGLSN